MSAIAALALCGCAEPHGCPPADLSPPERHPAHAFVASDYASSSIGLLDADGALIREAWIDGGTVEPRVVRALSGDVVIASRPLGACVLVAIDRYGTDTLTFLDPCAREGALRGQLHVGANPQDVIAIDGRLALVSRYDPSLDPAAPDLERGNDLLVVDWRQLRILTRVDLGSLDSLDTERAYARPARMVRLVRGAAQVVVAGLGRSSRDFMLAGPGAVAVVELPALGARPLALEGLTSCAEVDAVPGRPELAVVTCAGAWFSTEEERRQGAGLVSLELMEDGRVLERARWRAADHPTAPVFGSGTVPIDAARTLAVAMGDLGAGIPDRVAIVDLTSGSWSPVFEAGTAFVVGDGTLDASSGVALVPDADRGTVRRFELDPVVEREGEPVARCRRLPPREIRPLR